jgi:hypothetical protein
MRLGLFGWPRFVPAATYDSVAEMMAHRLTLEAGVTSVYQLGGVGAPGISDLDLLAVFPDGARSILDPRTYFDARANYLFTHGLFAVSRSRFEESLHSGWFASMRRRAGEELRTPGILPTDPEIRRQIAAEYLVSNYIARSVEMTYGLIGVRNLLLWGNALRYDLDLLGVTGGSLYDLTLEVADWRSRWFQRPIRADRIRRWFARFVPALGAFLSDLLDDRALAVPTLAPFRIARHARVGPGPRVDFKHQGSPLLSRMLPGGRRLFRLRHRFNRFDFRFPFLVPEAGSALANRFEFLDDLVTTSRRDFPRFTPLATGLQLRLRHLAGSLEAAAPAPARVRA